MKALVEKHILEVQS